MVKGQISIAVSWQARQRSTSALGSWITGAIAADWWRIWGYRDGGLISASQQAVTKG